MRVSQVRWLGRLEQEYKGEEELAQLHMVQPLSLTDSRGGCVNQACPSREVPPSSHTKLASGWAHDSTWSSDIFFWKKEGLKVHPRVLQP